MAQAATLTDSERAELREAVDGHGIRKTAAWIGCGRETLARAVSGLPLRTGSLLLIRSKTTDRSRGAV
jgi:hypothetical protein